MLAVQWPVRGCRRGDGTHHPPPPRLAAPYVQPVRPVDWERRRPVRPVHPGGRPCRRPTRGWIHAGPAGHVPGHRSPAPLTLGTVPVATTLPAATVDPAGASRVRPRFRLGASSGPAASIVLVAHCDSPGGQAVTAVVKVVSFAEDPLGWLTDKMGQGASGIMSWVADTANNATAADLTESWWIDAYKKAFAVAIILFGMLTLWNMSQLGRGKIGPEEFADTITIRSWGFFGGVIFGPPLAKFFIEGAGILSRGVISAMPGYNGGKMDATTVNKSIQGASEGKIIGGAFIAFLLLLVVCICALFLFVSLAVQTFAVYASGAVFPIAFTWVINIRHRGGSMKIPFMILAIIFSRPLLFFIVGLVMAMARAAVVQSSDDASTNLGHGDHGGGGVGDRRVLPAAAAQVRPGDPHRHERRHRARGVGVEPRCRAARGDLQAAGAPERQVVRRWQGWFVVDPGWPRFVGQRRPERC